MSVSPDSVTIWLQGRAFEIRPLTLRQVRDIEVLTSRKVDSNVEHIAGILDILLKRHHAAELPEGGVLEWEVTKEELNAAADAITRLTGGDRSAGEAKAAKPVAAQPEKTGATASGA